jgi:hypothetical protein
MTRTQLYGDEYIDPPKQGKEIICFFGELKGIRLVTREQEDNHICFEILTKDDEHWFVSSESASSHWLPDLLTAFSATKSWLEINAELDTSKFGTYGYRLKS